MQYGLKKAVLQRWTKGFKCGGVEGQDVVEKLKNAIQKRGGVSSGGVFIEALTNICWPLNF